MNPEIKKFWNDAGYEIQSIRPGPNDKCIYWCALKDGEQTDIVAATCHNNSGYIDSYHLSEKFGRGRFSEEEMLVAIKLIAFA
jgi:hypothetical protein